MGHILILLVAPNERHPRSFCGTMDPVEASVQPCVCLVRHGETAWTITGQHTGRTDIPLTSHGEDQAKALRARLRDMRFGDVFTSPLQRARRACELAGFGAVAAVDADLAEWNYGEYEGRRLRFEPNARRGICSTTVARTANPWPRSER